MRPANRPITLYRGDQYKHLVRFVTADGTTPIDKTGCIYAAQLRASPDAVDVLATFTCTAGDSTGQIWVTLDETTAMTLVPGRKCWDLQETSSSADVVTKLAGTADVIADVTRSGA